MNNNTVPYFLLLLAMFSLCFAMFCFCYVLLCFTMLLLCCSMFTSAGVSGGSLFEENEGRPGDNKNYENCCPRVASLKNIWYRI